ncbi:TetR/AcrR family transcriptional regulator [Nocardia sp. NBC_01503]|uniref:TetR/AcrR family transcriptional regulator n=1 Tax=Nocardia sp. NBC_01503 TaxID=2975997 RepID=UPI002E7B57DE|nr:helix-turn-helix domain-containing protein [Nocardia sp. NBC_01503]WTL31292.1 TetR/AcrR family transcriptional regulator [Nocardia sp. NBC_01503]
MGNREDLLAGARTCLFEKGFARTTVRDIATASGVSMAAIGYHFGSKEALLTAALTAATQEWGTELARALTATDATEPDALRRFAARWDTVRESITAHRGVWSATLDALSHTESREQLAATTPEAQRGLAGLFEGMEDSDPEASRRVGTFYQALLIGVAAQLLIDPETAPTGTDLAEALHRITAPAGQTATAG